MNTGNKNIDRHLRNLLDNGGITPFSGLKINITGQEPVMDSPWHIGEASATALSALAAALTLIWKKRVKKTVDQTIDIDLVTSALSTLRCNFMRQNGYPVPLPDIDYPTVGLYPVKDGKYVFINGGFPRLRRGILKTLNCPDDREGIRLALSKWNAADIESELQRGGYCCAMCRSPEEWETTEQGKALVNSLVDNGLVKPVVIEELCDGKPQPFSNLNDGENPLSGVRVLDLTHVLAGPTCGMMLAEQGADVMRVNGPQIPSILPFVMDTGHGKLNTQIDIKSEEGNRILWDLIDDGTDVISESYRPGTFDKQGLSPMEVANYLKRKNRGIIYVSINCYGHVGPWKDLPGWEQLAQTATGLAYEQGMSKGTEPRLLPTYPNDYITGYLAAYGVLAALLKRHVLGGSYHVKISLCATAMWLQRFGKVNNGIIPPPPIEQSVIDKLMIDNDNTGYGHLKYFGHPIKYSVTEAAWKRPSVPIGYNKPKW